MGGWWGGGSGVGGWVGARVSFVRFVCLMELGVGVVEGLRGSIPKP